MSSKPKVRNVVIECTEQPEVFDELEVEFKRHPEGCRKDLGVTPHRIAKAAMRYGLRVFKGKTPVEVRELISELAPTRKKRWDGEAKKWL